MDPDKADKAPPKAEDVQDAEEDAPPASTGDFKGLGIAPYQSHCCTGCWTAASGLLGRYSCVLGGHSKLSKTLLMSVCFLHCADNPFDALGSE